MIIEELMGLWIMRDIHGIYGILDSHGGYLLEMIDG